MNDTKKPQPAAYRLLTADELGVLRVVEVPAGPKWSDAAQVQKWGEANKEQAISSVCCSTNTLSPGTPALVAIGRKGRRIDIIDAHTGQQQTSLTAAATAGTSCSKAAADSQVQVTAVQFVPAVHDRPLQLVAATSDGMISVCSSSSQPTDSSWSVSRSFQAGSSTLCMDLDAQYSHLLVGGEGIQPSIWDLETGNKLWQAKGGKPNRQTLLVDKPYTTALAFLPSSSSTQQQSSPAANGAEVPALQLRFVAGSANAKIQVYDTAAGRRPQSEVIFGGESRVTALAPEPSGGRVWAANGMGSIQLLDLKTNKLMDALKGAGGSVRGLALYPGDEPLIASAGLDRFLRVHNTASKASAGRVYLKQQLTAVCWLPVQQLAAAEQQQGRSPASDAAGEVEGAADEQQQQRPGNKNKKSKHRGNAADVAAAGAEAGSGKKRRKKADVA